MRNNIRVDPAERSLLLKGILPLGFRGQQLVSRPVDIGIRDGVIAEVNESIDRQAYARTLDFHKHRYVSPGWIDLHTHVYEFFDGALDPTLIGPSDGVTTLVDAGSAGEATFHGFYEHTLKSSQFPIYAFLNIGSLAHFDYGPAHINLLKTMRCVETHRNTIRGIKVMASRLYLKASGLHPVRSAKRLAMDLGLPLMVHVAEPPVFLEELVGGLLGDGDIITHCYHGKAGNSIRHSEKRILALYDEAARQGIRLDVGHGQSSFSVESSRLAIERGHRPFSISSDLHAGNINGPVWSLSTVMSKMLACGLSLEEVVKMVTVNPGMLVAPPEYGQLEVGAAANLTVFELEEGSFEFTDSGAPDDMTSGADPRHQTRFTGSCFVCPRYAVIGTYEREAAPRGLDENRCSGTDLS